ncbi:MAG TPA: ATP-grasp peptide maturase system methyltransferase [Pseudonocardiaceae bacterium]|jgi:methyltransferase of ATP-grasp peptide maturase system|nr:ATP-grasp peptide maturase system methyltransferase [Pseudonocardiaceae bacterium]
MRTSHDPRTEAYRRRRRLVRHLASTGALTDSGWHAAFSEVPRHRFLHRFFRPLPAGQWAAVADTDADWLGRVYADRVLVTQLDGDPSRWETARRDGAVSGVPTSSSSQPTIMAIMLEALRADEHDRVLEIGTGTGYNAALLCRRQGADRVTTVDVDPDLVRSARDNLESMGYRPTCEPADGARGHPGNAPYDRVLATCAVSRIPPAWLAQTKPGGLVLTTLNRPLGAGMVRLVAAEDGRGRGRVLAEDGRFMPLRAHRAPSAEDLIRRAGTGLTHTRTPLRAIAEHLAPTNPFEFFAGLALPEVAALGGADRIFWLVHPDGSWARRHAEGSRQWVTQGGPRRLWDLAEAAHVRWIELGRPRRDRFGVTVDGDHQEIWLDTPESPHRWSL